MENITWETGVNGRIILRGNVYKMLTCFNCFRRRSGGRFYVNSNGLLGNTKGEGFLSR